MLDRITGQGSGNPSENQPPQSEHSQPQYRQHHSLEDLLHLVFDCK